MSNPLQTVHLSQVRDYRFDITFGPGLPPLQADEPAPLGLGQGPTPVQLLAASVGNCLSASLLFACRKYKQDPGALACEVQAEVGRNEQGRMRVLHLNATLRLGVAGSTIEHLDRVLGGFEAFCTVTESVRGGIPVTVGVVDAQGQRLK